jgi:protein TonB
MLDELLESKAGRERRGGGALVSVAAHATVVILAVVATGSATPRPPAERPTEILIAIPRPERPTPPAPSVPTPPGGVVTAGDDMGPPSLPPIADIVPGIPPVDLGASPTLGEDFARPDMGRGGEGSVAGEDRSGVPGPAWGWQVDRVAILASGNSVPRYPEALKQYGVEGEVLAQFVVDTTGRVEPGSITILRADHDLFAHAVREALRGMRFVPAEAGARKVRQLVQLPFSFALDR